MVRAIAKETMEKAAADYREGIDTNENENGEDDDDFNYMTREEQRARMLRPSKKEFRRLF